MEILDLGNGTKHDYEKFNKIIKAHLNVESIDATLFELIDSNKNKSISKEDLKKFFKNSPLHLYYFIMLYQNNNNNLSDGKQ